MTSSCTISEKVISLFFSKGKVGDIAESVLQNIINNIFFTFST